ncbi:hypothetical protein ACTOWA_25195 [Herbaspirillum seropedicae]|uniref:hypothetical protein n=1 Tax=Herbaspirillum seropedicae TaxID=964 RepID=UPI003F8D4FCB
MKLALRLLTLAFSLSALSAAAQPGVGFGDDPNSWRGRSHGFRFDRDNTFGWAMMSQRERIEHRKKLMAVTSYNDCKAYMAEHHQQMQERAAEQGKSLPAAPSDVCDQMKASGQFNK